MLPKMRIVMIALLSTLLLWLLVCDTQAEDKATFVGSEGCLCHADPVHKGWEKSRHARAFDLLKLAGQEKNEKCLPCHTTGYGKGGYGAPGVTANLEGVQCEECHGAASEHVSTMDKTKVTRTPSAAVCARCHQDLDIHAIQ